MTAYTHSTHSLQQNVDCVDILQTSHLTRITPDGTEVPSVAEECAFQRRLSRPLTYSQLRHCIIQDYEYGFVSARDTMQRLKDNDLYGDAETFLKIFSAGVAALNGGNPNG